MKTLNILFTSVGRRVSLVRSFRRAYEELGLKGKIHSIDLKKDAPAAFVSDVHTLCPRVSSPDYIPFLETLCRKEQIQLVVPLIDTELHLLAPHRARFEAMGTKILVGSEETNKICFDKRNTAEFFQKHHIPTPAIIPFEQALALPVFSYPLMLKPADGSCSVGVTKIRNPEELKFFSQYVANAIVQPLLTGQEYTMDVLVDFQGKVRCVVPRKRMETRAGEISKGVTVKDAELISLTRAVAEKLPGTVGCVTIQAFKTPNQGVQFLEINPRFGGGFPLSAQAGADYPKWILEWMLGRDPQIALDGWKDGVVMLRFDEAIFTTKEAI